MKQVENSSSSSTVSSCTNSRSCCNKQQKYYSEDDSVILPGFRFHPTDEELLSFYLKRKVDNNKPLTLDIIKEIDIYKYDPWDLPKLNGEKDWYFFCQRGRKYRNSVRPNRVTGSGFWKATGIDRPVCGGDGGVIGLKKSLVYYIGSAGKGSKTDWMMHEFRLPHSTHEAEIWTVCRISKRSVSFKKCVPPEWTRSKRAAAPGPEPSPPASCGFISFTDFGSQTDQSKPYCHETLIATNPNHYQQNNLMMMMMGSSPAAAMSGFVCSDIDELLRLQGNGDWEDLRSVV